MKDHTALLERTDEVTSSVFGPPLAEVLRQIGVRPFTPGSVASYKKAMTRKRFQIWKKMPGDVMGPILLLLGLAINTLAFWWLGREMSAAFSLDFSLGYIGWLPIASLVVIVAMMMKFGTGTQYPVPRLALWVFLTLSFFAISSTIGPVVLFGPSNKEWKCVFLGEYKKTIPQPVLDRVEEIRMRCPKARFFVEELARKPDPFLVVTLGSESYHIGVWLEPKFDAKCLV